MAGELNDSSRAAGFTPAVFDSASSAQRPPALSRRLVGFVGLVGSGRGGAGLLSLADWTLFLTPVVVLFAHSGSVGRSAAAVVVGRACRVAFALRVDAGGGHGQPAAGVPFARFCRARFGDDRTEAVARVGTVARSGAAGCPRFGSHHPHRLGSACPGVEHRHDCPRARGVRLMICPTSFRCRTTWWPWLEQSWRHCRCLLVVGQRIADMASLAALDVTPATPLGWTALGLLAALCVLSFGERLGAARAPLALRAGFGNSRDLVDPFRAVAQRVYCHGALFVGGICRRHGGRCGARGGLCARRHCDGERPGGTSMSRAFWPGSRRRMPGCASS